MTFSNKILCFSVFILILASLSLGLTQPADTFEDGDISEYHGKTGYFSLVSGSPSPASGSYAASIHGNANGAVYKNFSAILKPDNLTFYYRADSGGSYPRGSSIYILGKNLNSTSNRGTDSIIHSVSFERNGCGNCDGMTLKHNGTSTEILDSNFTPGEWFKIVLDFNWQQREFSATSYDSSDTQIISKSELKMSDIGEGVQGIAYDADNSYDGITNFYDAKKQFGFNASTRPASEISSSSAKLSGEIEEIEGLSQLNISFRYRKESQSSWSNTEKQSVNSEGTYTQTVSSLESGESYEYSVKASNGENIYIDTEKTFTTTTNSPPAFNQVATTPSEWNNIENVTVTVNASDPDGTISSLEADIYEAGVKENTVSLSQEASGNWTAENLFRVGSGDKTYKISLTATDDANAKTTYNITKQTNNVSLTWEHSGNPEGFNIYSNLTTEQKSVVAPDINSKSFEHISTGFSDNLYVCYTVSAFNNYGESEKAPEKCSKV